MRRSKPTAKEGSTDPVLSLQADDAGKGKAKKASKSKAKKRDDSDEVRVRDGLKPGALFPPGTRRRRAAEPRALR